MPDLDELSLSFSLHMDIKQSASHNYLFLDTEFKIQGAGRRDTYLAFHTYPGHEAKCLRGKSEKPFRRPSCCHILAAPRQDP